MKQPAQRILRTVDAVIVAILCGFAVALALGQVHGISMRLPATAWVSGLFLVILTLRALVGLLVGQRTGATEGPPTATARASYGELIRSLPT